MMVYGLPVRYDTRIAPGQWDCPPGQRFVTYHDAYDCMTILFWQAMRPHFNRLWREQDRVWRALRAESNSTAVNQ